MSRATSLPTPAAFKVGKTKESKGFGAFQFFDRDTLPLRDLSTDAATALEDALR